MAAPASASHMMHQERIVAGRHGINGGASVDSVQLVDNFGPTSASYATMIAGLALLGMIECRRKVRQQI
jgi:hypothetical protein